MPLYNLATDSKVCSKCETEFTGQNVSANFFKVQAMKDGYASRCKKCYYAKATPEEATARNDRAIERKLTRMVEAEPIKERPASRKAYTHNDADLRALEKSTGLKFKSWLDMGDCWMPVLGKVT